MRERAAVNPMVVLREEFDDWAILFNPETAAAVGINPVGAAIWKMMDGRRDVAEIVEELGEKFADVPEAAFEQVSGFVKELARRGFVGYEIE